jgi:O-antigen/teichoic acid export membrane protein
VSKRFLRDNLVTTIAAFAAGFLMFGLQSYGGHHLDPKEFGRAFALIGFYGIVTRPAASFGRQVAWHTSRRSEEERTRPSLADSVALRLMLWLFAAGIVIAGASTIFGTQLAGFFHTTTSEVIIIAWSSPFMLAMAAPRGVLQGEHRFTLWAGLSLFQPLLYVIGVISLITSYKVNGVLFAITAGSAISFFVGIVCVRATFVRALHAPMRMPWRKDAPFVVNGIVATLTNGVFLSADVVTVQHYLSHQIAGQYAAVAAIGNVLFSATLGVVSVMFTNVVERQHRGESSKQIVFAVIALFMTVSIVGAIVLQFLGSTILHYFAGAKYEGASSYLGWYAIGMGILSWSTAVMHSQQARNKFSLLWALIPAVIARIVLLILFHHSPMQVVLISDALVLAFAMVLLAMFLLDERRLANPPSHAQSSRASAMTPGTAVQPLIEGAG